jgi:hypothetical protein
VERRLWCSQFGVGGNTKSVYRVDGAVTFVLVKRFAVGSNEDDPLVEPTPVGRCWRRNQSLKRNRFEQSYLAQSRNLRRS